MNVTLRDVIPVTNESQDFHLAHVIEAGAPRERPCRVVAIVASRRAISAGTLSTLAVNAGLR